MTKKKTPKIGRWILLLLIILGIYLFTKKITLNAKVTIEQGENVSKIFNELSTIEKLHMKIYLYMHKDISFSKLEAGEYIFTGNYTKAQLVSKILQGPDKEYLRLTLLEGRSIYDIDAALARKGYITGGDYIKFVTNPTIITKYQERYAFLANYKLTTLEGFLYPDTYQVDKKKNIIDQLVYLQLENFNNKVRKNITNPVDRYLHIILASIVEKEERNDENRPTVAGIFLKRLNIGMTLGADITLCYGLKMTYLDCTPAVIARNVSDTNNKYNTRTVRGLPPTPICNPTRASINAVLNPKKSDYLYYLHDTKGNIHYGTTLEEHNANKAKYLQ